MRAHAQLILVNATFISFVRVAIGNERERGRAGAKRQKGKRAAEIVKYNNNPSKTEAI